MAQDIPSSAWLAKIQLRSITNVLFSYSRFEDAVELLLKHGARVDVEARMCWPGHHQHNCEERGRHSRSRINQAYASSDKLQCAIYYAIDGDQVQLLTLILGQSDYPVSRFGLYSPNH